MTDDMPLSPNNTMPSLRVRKDHTCISIGLVGRDLMHMCDKCKFFQLRIDGISGRKPGKMQVLNARNHGSFPLINIHHKD